MFDPLDVGTTAHVLLPNDFNRYRQPEIWLHLVADLPRNSGVATELPGSLGGGRPDRRTASVRLMAPGVRDASMATLGRC